MWAWIGVFFSASFALTLPADVAPVAAKLAAFATIAVGAIGSVGAGLLADRLGRTTLTIAAMAVSGTCAATIGFLFGGSPWPLVALALVWGISIVADSAQFSASIAELADPARVGRLRWISWVQNILTPLMRVEVRDPVTHALLTQVDIVLPVSDEMDCRGCHASGSGPAAQPAAGWVNDPNAARDYRLNILRLHDEKQVANPRYAHALATSGYAPPDSSRPRRQRGTPILCAACHLSNALPGTGLSGVTPLTRAMHDRHAEVIRSNGPR